MFKKIISLILSFLILLTTTALAGCSASLQVPDSVIERFVKNSDRYDNDYSISWVADHNFDKAANVDSVLITMTASSTYGKYITTCTADFQYNSAAKNWTLLSSGKWSKAEYTFNDKLTRSWDVKNFGESTYTLKVTSVSSGSISVDYAIKEKVYGGLATGTLWCEMSGKGMGKIKGDYFALPLTLSGEYFVNKGGISGQKTQNTELTVFVSIKDGIYLAYFADEIRHSLK